jgi:hypothetical protein
MIVIVSFLNLSLTLPNSFTESKYTFTNLVTFLHTVTPFVCSQDQSFILTSVMPSTLFRMNYYSINVITIDIPVTYTCFRITWQAASLVYVFLAYSSRLLLCCQTYINDQFWAIAFNTFINGLCTVINHCYHFASNLEDHRAIKSPYDCSILQSNIDCIRERCSANFM